MPLWRSWDAVPDDLGRTVVVIGNFDGVHRGHQAVLGRARALADGPERRRVVAVTFDPHPMQVLLPERAPARLTDPETRAGLLRDAGADDVLVLPFSREVAAWSPEEFVRRVLADALHAAVVVVGANFRFGAKASGDVATLVELGRVHDFTVEGLELTGDGQVWSSTYVRERLACGDVAGAARALGRRVTVSGTVTRGDRRGRELGYPTANVPVGDDGMVPADGVYACWLSVDDVPESRREAWPAAVSVGTNPTFEGDRQRRVEAYVLGSAGAAAPSLDLYDRPVTVTFVDRVRGMERFESVEELVAQMDDDVDRSRALLLPDVR